MTTQRIFLPPLDSRWRLAADWVPPEHVLDLIHNGETLWGQPNYDFDSFTKATGISTNGHGSTWVDAYHKWRREQRDHDGTFPAGTIIQIERYHVSRSGEDEITLKVLISPKRQLTPKKKKGTMRGAGRLYVRLADFNTFPALENVDDLQDL